MKKVEMSTLLMMSLIHTELPSFAQPTPTMVEQVSALEGYIKTAENGYRIAEQGISAIGDLKKDEFNLHSQYFGSLEAVSPAVREIPEVNEILLQQADLLDSYSRAFDEWVGSPWLQPPEINVLEAYYASLISSADTRHQSLSDLITDGKLTMDDGERVRRITGLYDQLLSEESIVEYFIARTQLLIQQRRKEAGMIDSFSKN